MNKIVNATGLCALVLVVGCKAGKVKTDLLPDTTTVVAPSATVVGEETDSKSGVDNSGKAITPADAGAEAWVGNAANLLSKDEFMLAAETLVDEINPGMSRNTIDTMVFWVTQNLVEKLHGKDDSLTIQTFVPPDGDSAYKQVVSAERITIGDRPISSSVLKAGTWTSAPLVDWKSDAQRVVVAHEYLDKVTPMPPEEAQKELERYDAVKKIVVMLNGIVESRCRIGGEYQDHYIDVKKSLSSIKERLKTYRTRFLSYAVVSPYLYKAHCCLFVGISSSLRMSSLNRMYPEQCDGYKDKGIKLLAQSCHKEWLYSCAQDVRDQFVDIQRFVKENVKMSELEEYKIIMTLSNCNDPSKPRDADFWWK